MHIHLYIRHKGLTSITLISDLVQNDAMPEFTCYIQLLTIVHAARS